MCNDMRRYFQGHRPWDLAFGSLRFRAGDFRHEVLTF